MGSVNSFVTARATGSTFKMALISDSHIFQWWNGAATCGTVESDRFLAFDQTLRNVRDANPDVILLAGDEWHLHCNACSNDCDVDGVSSGTGTVADATESELRLRQWVRLYHGIFDRFPFHIAGGNHDGEVSWGNDIGDSDCNHWDGLDALAEAARLKYFVNPDTAYGAANGSEDGDYYAVMPSEDVEIFVLDTQKYGVSGAVYPDDYPEAADDWTLGVDQAAWIGTELGNSTATWKLILAHSIVGACAGDTTCYHYSKGDVLCTDDGTVDTDFLGANAQALHEDADGDSAHFLLGHDHIAWTAQKDDVIYIRGGRPSRDSTTTDTWFDLDGNSTADSQESTDHASDLQGYMLITVNGTTSLTWEWILTGFSGNDVTNGAVDFRCTITNAATPDLSCTDL
jgi:hypothetical protein